MMLSLDLVRAGPRGHAGHLTRTCLAISMHSLLRLSPELFEKLVAMAGCIRNRKGASSADAEAHACAFEAGLTGPSRPHACISNHLMRCFNLRLIDLNLDYIHGHPAAASRDHKQKAKCCLHARLSVISERAGFRMEAVPAGRRQGAERAWIHQPRWRNTCAACASAGPPLPPSPLSQPHHEPP